MRAADILEHEHETVLVVTKAARREAEAIEETGQVRPLLPRKILTLGVA
ncbi:MAG: hypothetical protein AMXMBFR82_46430 [Candidatus Hydrogenedentota bacterium]